VRFSITLSLRSLGGDVRVASCCWVNIDVDRFCSPKLAATLNSGREVPTAEGQTSEPDHESRSVDIRQLMF
jgi:hypothetical protein